MAGRGASPWSRAGLGRGGDELLPGTQPTAACATLGLHTWLCHPSPCSWLRQQLQTEPPHLGFPRGRVVRMGEALMAFPGPQFSVLTLSDLVKPLRYLNWFNEV